MRRMSFGLTIDAMRKGQKTVTRRKAGTWKGLGPGDVLLAVDRVMGFQKGQRAEILGAIVVRSVRLERLAAMSVDDVAREGFGDMSPEEFIEMFSKNQGARPDDEVLRIRFAHLERGDEMQTESAKSLERLAGDSGSNVVAVYFPVVLGPSECYVTFRDREPLRLDGGFAAGVRAGRIAE